MTCSLSDSAFCVKKNAKKEAKKKAKVEESADSDSKKESANDSTEEGNTEEAVAPAAAPITPVKSESSAENPEAIKRVFVGNLAWAVDEDCIRKFAEPGVIQDIHWTTDRETGKFMGRGFLEFETAAMATTFIEKDVTMLFTSFGRYPIFAPFGPPSFCTGDVWNQSSLCTDFYAHNIFRFIAG